MATYTPPPYFPQGQLAPPDKNRYRKFKLAVVGFAVLGLVLAGAAIAGMWYLLKWLF